jgi:hypothetical protein
MRSEPTEWTTLAKMRTTSRRPSERVAATHVHSTVLDEAFADLPADLTHGRRIDRPRPQEGGPEAPAERHFLGHIASEVASLNRRCEFLSDMLRQLDTSLPAISQ